MHRVRLVPQEPVADAEQPKPGADPLAPGVSGRHLATALSAAPALVDTILHIADLRAALGAGLADFGAGAAGVFVRGCPEQHEVRAGSADLGAGQH